MYAIATRLEVKTAREGQNSARDYLFYLFRKIRFKWQPTGFFLVFLHLQ